MPRAAVSCWWSAGRNTLRRRLTVGTVLVLLLACIGLGLASELFVRSTLVQRLDDQLVSAGSRYSASLARDGSHGDGDGPNADETIPGQAVGTLGARVVNGKVVLATVVDESGKNRTLSSSTANTSALLGLRPSRGATTIHLDGAGDFRVRAVTGRGGAIEVTGLPLHSVDETLTQLFFLVLVSFAVVVTLGGVVSALVVRRALRPLEHLSHSALAVTELALDRSDEPLPTTATENGASSEIAQVSAAFDKMLGRVSQAMVERDATEAQLRQFVADASHELRTPLATIRAYAEYGASPESGELPADTADALARIRASADRMGLLVADLLLLARLDAGRPLERQEVDLTRLVVETVADSGASAPDHRWKLDLPEESVTVVGDEDRLHQVLANLLANARMHTPGGTEVLVSLRADADAVQLTVSDDGPGIPAAQLASLFDRFTRGDSSRSRESGGSGLGLAIAHGIVVAHGGTLTVASPGPGTTFVLRLPV